MTSCLNQHYFPVKLQYQFLPTLIYLFNVKNLIEEPYRKMEHLARKLAIAIIKPTALRGISPISDIDLTDDSIFIEPKSIFLGETIQVTLNRLLSEGDISQHKYDIFHTVAHLYFKDALQYIQNKFPVKNEVIQKKCVR